MLNQLEPLYRKINYNFKEPKLLVNALTHRSLGANNNERLEFLGDSLLNLMIAEALFQRFPQAPEGELSRLRAYLVKGETLAKVALELDLGAFVQLGSGELKSGGFRRASILADCVEAMLAAIYLDSDFETCRGVVLDLYQSRLNNQDIFDNVKDPKTILQEWLQGERLKLPAYSLEEVTGEQHNQKFHVSCEIESLSLKSVGSGTTRRKAEKVAAKEMLLLIKELPKKKRKKLR